MPHAFESGRSQDRGGAFSLLRGRRLPTGLAGATFWLVLWFGLLWLLRQTPAPGQTLLGWMQVLVGISLIALAVPLAWRLLHRRLLWSLRNKLILTYLLIGLAPVVMLATLAAVSAYFAAGQFSIHLADSRMRQELDQLSAQNAAVLARVMRRMESGAIAPPLPGPPAAPGFAARRAARSAAQPAAQAPTQAAAPDTAETAAEGLAQATPVTEELPDPLRARLRPHTETFLNGAPWSPGPGFRGAGPPPAANAAAPSTPLGLPPWAADLHGDEFHGLVLDGEDLYLVAIDQRRVEGRGILSSVTSLPVDSALLDLIAKGLGRVSLSGVTAVSSHPASAKTQVPIAEPSAAGKSSGHLLGNQLHGSSAYGGAEPLGINICDFRVPFISTLDTTDWDTGQPSQFAATIDVHSRPSLLYRQLFGSSFDGIVTRQYRYGLVALCIVFALIEVIALWAALRLSRQITASVHRLYSATQRVDHGDFVHRIPAPYSAKQDQLGELSRSFNRMTGSLERLMVEQQEKERLQSELTIAQEVQANLFPHHVHSLPTLELHGICRPARTVSGDYYDFLIFHHPDHPDGTPGDESGAGIALGDISGKGISAALLMATLHSAVRAYRLASEDLVYSASAVAALGSSREDRAGDGKLFESPGQILSLLNRHLYRSTQPEKYATLFLAHYDVASAQLTYSNAGHLPPIVLGRDGKLRRLDCGGTVVGLMDGVRYEQGRVPMRSGDILVAYSDGITEPENDFGEFGEARMMEVVARYRDQPLHIISAQVMLALDAWIGAAEQPDDITLVLARQR